MTTTRCRSRTRITDATMRAAVAVLRHGLSTEVAGAQLGISGRALRQRLASWGIREMDLRPHPADPAALDPHERRKRLAVLSSERRWERAHAAGKIAYQRQATMRRKDTHILLTEDAHAALHAHAARRGGSMSSIVSDLLYQTGITPEP